MLRDKILKKESGIVFYSLTPPKVNTDLEKIKVIANKQIERLRSLNIDGLLLYDIQDESSRTDKERTFAFTPTIAPENYSRNYLTELKVPKIIYKSMANLTQGQFVDWLLSNQDIEYAVLVGASSQQQVQLTNFSLHDAYDIKNKHLEPLLIGGVTIPERHTKKGDEHLRIFNKVDKGCSFFVSQCVYSLNDTKNLLSDFYYTTLDNGRAFSPIIFTLAPCGSLKTLQFMEWLGIEVPKWLYNDLKHSKDILTASVNTCRNIAIEIMDYATGKNIPIGFNIESVSIKKEEIEASNQLLIDVLKLLKTGKSENKSENKASHIMAIDV
ncbi:methylenetetrahydrofolate reductase [Chitinophagaceae bacterium LB-8]|uniref:Methylenetetrahydrofolate reductase n=1 Tax=Paraflavisolibacter caeni TaxID=2982496 RepID=A0A9X2XXS6_9BACT|nr:methylenetetrahydrofolate reductase [Paraflavisolibacter caeni]MCU7549633.1 methylenetetrahydrofolate reductase [Paraflavisolibacter caeni]